VADFAEAIKLNEGYARRPTTTAPTPISTRTITTAAIADFTQAIKLDAKDSFAYHDRGVAYYEKKDFEHAIATSKRRSRSTRTMPSPQARAANDIRGQRGYDRGAMELAQPIR